MLVSYQLHQANFIAQTHVSKNEVNKKVDVIHTILWHPCML